MCILTAFTIVGSKDLESSTQIALLNVTASTSAPSVAPHAESGESGGPGLRAWLLSVFLSLIPAVIGGVKTADARKHIISGYQAIEKSMKTHESNALLKRFARKDFTEHKGFMGVVESELDFLVEYLIFKKARLVIFVDDLDRCNQDTTMQILWAVKLLLCRGPISCWIAIDSKIVVDFIEKDYEVAISGYQYLEKIM